MSSLLGLPAALVPSAGLSDESEDTEQDADYHRER